MGRISPVLLLALALSGCGTGGVVLGTPGEYLFIANDQLVTPGERTWLRARLQGGDLLSDRPGHTVMFYRDGSLHGASVTDADGVARLHFTPSAKGDYVFEARVSPVGLTSPPGPVPSLLIACRPHDEPILVVDIDRTLVESGFVQVLFGEPEPLEDSARVMRRLAKEFTIVYLTHRPEYFDPVSRLWLCEHTYPAGPVLFADIKGFVKGSEEYKTATLAELSRRFTNIRIGIGDLITDVCAYHQAGASGYLILHPQLMEKMELLELSREVEQLPPSVQVVTSWREIERGIFDGDRFAPEEMAGLLRRQARAMDDDQNRP